MSEYYNRAEQENLTNPKNRFLGLFCHAKEVGESWGYNWSFPTGVVIFSIIIGFASFWDLYFIAKKEVFKSEIYTFIFKLWVIVKIFSDFISFAGIAMACYAVNRGNLKYSVISYYVIVLSLLLNTIFLITCIYYLFKYPGFIGLFCIPWGILEFGLILFSWILFCNQVYLGRKQRMDANQTGY